MAELNNPPAVEVVVCVHNAPRDVERCLGSVSQTLRASDRLIVVDDGSEDETRLICERFAEADNVRLLRRPQGSGFCRAANAGLRETRADMVVVLNSDTVVTHQWLDRLEACMKSNWQVGIVGPLSNAGGWQSLPFLANTRDYRDLANDSDGLLNDISEYVSAFEGLYAYPFVEQINGFCFGISREVVDTIGLFDEERFPMGYGEESDFTLRALDAGFLCAIALDCFVYHAKTKSYSSTQRQKYNDDGQRKLGELYGFDRVRQSVINTKLHPTLRAIRKQAAADFAERRWLLEGNG